MKWDYPGRLIANNVKMLYGGTNLHRLKITGVTLNNEGKYMCYYERNNVINYGIRTLKIKSK